MGSLHATPLLSIIVPVYNVAPYLRQCLDSIAAQTLPPDSYEVIMVDDKSTDGSLDICREYDADYRNFYVISLPKHTPGGCGTPSNIGMRAALGTYIGFVDSDDYVCPEMFEELLCNALDGDADIALCDQWRLDEANGNILDGPDTGKFRLLDSPTFSRLLDKEKKSLYLNLDTPPWLKIIKSSFIKEQDLFFPEGDFFFEDVVFHWKCLLTTSRIRHLSKKMVTHRIGRQGQTIASSGRDLFGVLSNLKYLKAFLLQNGFYEQYRLVLSRCAIKRYAWIMPKLDPPLRREFLKQVDSLALNFSWKDIPAYCRINQLQLRTGVRHYLLARDYRVLAYLAPATVDAAVAGYGWLREKFTLEK
jgi:glycosyltransferase involved in cell wall biosynthesis